MLAVLAPDAIWISDGGGKVAAARRVIRGSEAITRMLIKIEQKYSRPFTYRMARLNGETALVVIYAGRLETVFIFSTDADRITAIRAVRNPEKLAWLAAHTGLGAGAAS